MEKINVAQLLKDCPSGMELDCSMFDGVEFDSIIDNDYLPIRCRIKNPDGGYNVYHFTKYGYWNNDCKAKCVIFPKGKTTWEEFHIPFNDGDIVYFITENDNEYIAIFKDDKDIYLETYIDVAIATSRYSLDVSYYIDNIKEQRFATEEEKAKLFDAIKANGYKWNEETKTLEVLPKFKVGDRIKQIKTGNIYEIIKIIPNYYITNYLGSDIMISFNDHDEYELVPVKPRFKVGDTITNGKTSITIDYIDDEYYYEISRNIANRLFIKFQDDWDLISSKFPVKFDITTLKPFDKVLVRDFDNTPWEIEFFSRLLDGKHFKCLDVSYTQCIPYEGNEHLLGKTGDCDKYFKTWE